MTTPAILRQIGICLLFTVLSVPVISAAPVPTGWRWLLPSQVVPFHPEGLAFGNGTFVGVGGSGAVATSPDGLNWTPHLPGTFAYFGSVAFGGGTFVAGGGGVISTSADGVHWEHHSQTGVSANVELRRIRYPPPTRLPSTSTSPPPGTANRASWRQSKSMPTRTSARSFSRRSPVSSSNKPRPGIWVC